jgi:hypothetical protein
MRGEHTHVTYKYANNNISQAEEENGGEMGRQQAWWLDLKEQNSEPTHQFSFYGF